MKPSDKIDFQNVGELTRRLCARKITPTRFSIEAPERDVANGIYSAMKAQVAQRGKELVFDADTRSHIEKAARWLADPKGKFGLMLMGVPGNGKTSMMQAIARLIAYVTEETSGYSERKTMRILTAKSISRTCGSDTGEYDALFNSRMLGIDDLGEEPKEVIVYGMVHTPLIDLLSERYSKQLFTIVTTNLDKELLKDKYGPRIYDRLKEMMEIVTFKNQSYRR